MPQFLLIVKAKPGLTMQPHLPGRKQQFANINRQHKSWLLQELQAGNASEIKVVVNQNPQGIVAVAVVTANSAAEVVQKGQSGPMGPYQEYEAQPLTNFQQQTAGLQLEDFEACFDNAYEHLLQM